MKETKEQNSKHKKLNANQGITLIALIITIIVMLILVAVTINMAVNGGLFGYAGKATGETQNAIDEEQALANGGVSIDGKWYNSIDDYINGVVEPENVSDWIYTVEDNGTITITGYSGDDTVVTIPNYINGIPVKKITSDYYFDSLWDEEICADNNYNGYYPAQSTITKVIVSEGITEIGSWTFQYSLALQEISLPESVEVIGEDAFNRCDELKTITFPSRLITIGNNAFCNTGFIGEIILPDSLENVGYGAFEDYENNVILSVPWKEGEKPEGWHDRWYDGDNITIKYAE